MVSYLYVVYNLLHAIWNHKEPWHSCLLKTKKKLYPILMFTSPYLILYQTLIENIFFKVDVCLNFLDQIHQLFKYLFAGSTCYNQYYNIMIRAAEVHMNYLITNWNAIFHPSCFHKASYWLSCFNRTIREVTILGIESSIIIDSNEVQTAS